MVEYGRKQRFFPYSFLCLLLFIFPSMAGGEPSQEYTDSGAQQQLIGGVVKPSKEAVLSFVRSGTVVSLPDLCQQVKKGETIARILDAQAKIDLSQAAAELESAQLSLTTARHQRNKTKRLLDEKILAPIALTEADFSLKQAENKLKIAEANLERYRILLDGCRLTAPFDGVLVEISAGIGEQASPGKPIARLVDLNQLEISIDLPLPLSRRLTPGVSTAILIDNRPAGIATVKNVVPMVDAGSGLQRVVWQVVSNESLIAGRYVTLKPWENMLD